MTLAPSKTINNNTVCIIIYKIESHNLTMTIDDSERYRNINEANNVFDVLFEDLVHLWKKEDSTNQAPLKTFKKCANDFKQKPNTRKS